jgi:hypothetical protein
MIDKDVFPRDENGKLLHKKPCQSEGCDYPNWHVCLVGKPDTFPQLLNELQKGRTYSYRFTDAHRDNITAAQRDRWAQRNAVRDRKMVEYYKNNHVGHKQVAQHFGVAPSTALKALKKAEARGEVEMRKRGLVLAYDAS